MSLSGRHLVDRASDLEQIVELGEVLPVQRVYVDVGNLLEDHLLEAQLLRPLRRLRLDRAAADPHVRI